LPDAQPARLTIACTIAATSNAKDSPRVIETDSVVLVTSDGAVVVQRAQLSVSAPLIEPQFVPSLLSPLSSINVSVADVMVAACGTATALKRSAPMCGKP
jgi:hypothetical protein